MNCDSILATDFVRTNPDSTTTTATNADSFVGSWFTITENLFPDDNSGDGFDNSFFGTIFVSTGKMFSLSSNSVFGTTLSGVNRPVVLEPIPEPTTLGLAGLVAMGLGRRRR